MPRGVYQHKPNTKEQNRKIGLASRGHAVAAETRKRIGAAHRGKVVSEATKAKLRPTMFKKGLTPWNKGKPHPAVRGERNPTWRGGITSTNKRIRGSIEYKLWRDAVFKRDNWTCKWCGVRGTKLQADHIKPFAYFPELRFAIDNGRTLCKPCHQKTDTFGRKVP